MLNGGFRKLWCDFCGCPWLESGERIHHAVVPKPCPQCGSQVWREGGEHDPSQQGIIVGSALVKWPNTLRR